jgi:hypothetical protein
MVDFYFIFISLFYLVAILFIHIQLKKGKSRDTSDVEPIIKNNKTVNLATEHFSNALEQSLSDHLNLEEIEMFDNFKFIGDSPDPDLGDEWSKVYEGNQMKQISTDLSSKAASTLNPEYQKTSLLDDTQMMNPMSSNISPFDEFSDTSYMAFSPTM